MNNEIFYFTGTGNSLAIARDIAKDLQFKLSPISPTQNDRIERDSLGIVFPIYMLNAPLLVYDFIKKIASAKYLFIIMTMGGASGTTIKKISKLLGKRDITISSSFSFQMPDNYIVWNNAADEKTQTLLLDHTKQSLDKAISIIRDQKSHSTNEKQFIIDPRTTVPFPLGYIPKSIQQWFCDMGYPHINTMDKNFKLNDKCNGCGMCKKICPVVNIKMVDSRPTWTHNCQQCLACLQWCPREAINYKSNSVGRKRYHHPGVKVSDLFTK